MSERKRPLRMEPGNTSSNLLSFNLFHVVSKNFQFLFISSGFLFFFTSPHWKTLENWNSMYDGMLIHEKFSRVKKSKTDFSIYFYKRNSFELLLLHLLRRFPRANQHQDGRNCKDRTQPFDDYKYDAIVFSPHLLRLRLLCADSKRCNIFHYFMSAP